MKFILLTAALLIPATVVMAQDAAPPPSQAPAVRAAPPAMRKPAPAPKAPSITEISQIDGIRQVDAATYEIDGKTPNGTVVMLRMNAFVMQDLGRRLGTFGR